jgi:hypothetical protein
MAVFFVILYYVFAPDGVVTGSIFYMLFGSALSLIILCVLFFWALYVYLPKIAELNNIAIFDWTPHNTGIYASIAAALVTYVILFTRVQKSKKRRRRRGNLQ